MNRSLSIAASGMNAQQTITDTIANNIANVSTTGYKKGTVNFQDMLYETIAAPGSTTSTSTLPLGMQMGTGVMPASASKVFTQGSLQSSSRDLDVAIEGEGFFPVTMPDGSTAYTRSGNFTMDSTGKVVTVDGYEVQNFPALDPQATSITIMADGTVSCYVNGASVEKGRIQIARIPNPEGMTYQGHNLFLETEASGTAVLGNPAETNNGKIAQHYLEGSNVDIVTEMVNMISAQRAYELNSKTMKTAEENLRTVTQLKT